MEDKRSSSNLFNWPSLALLAALASNLFWLHSPLKSSRPDDPATRPGIAIGDQTAEARLWQDPFEVVRRAEAPAGATNPLASLGELARQMRHQAPQTTNALVLAVMVPGSPYAESSEWRRRMRMAVVSGLARGGYVPMDREHLGQCVVGWPRTAALTSTAAAMRSMVGAGGRDDLRLTLPFEWFQWSPLDDPSREADRVGTNRILLVWLQEELLEDHPLTRLALLMHALETTNAAPRLPWRVIGPYSSGTLRAALLEADRDAIFGPMPEHMPLRRADAAVFPAADYWSRVEFFSPFATASDSFLIPGGMARTAAPDNKRSEVQHRLGTLGIKFHNAISTDDLLCAKLVEELSLRGVDAGRDSIALVSEWDTFYGRALPLAWVTNVARLRGIAPAQLHNIVRASYLRGLDGKLPGTEGKATDRSSGRDDSQKARASELASLERPEGNSQLDYVPRLAASLEAMQRQLPERGHGPIKAIGVLGSDVFDKLLILQALRTRFPSAIFFTTDLNTRLAYSAELAWTRNLVVASSFGLALNARLQGAVPPFRDSYQTAAFLATQVACGIVPSGWLNEIEPRIYELGLAGPRDFSRDTRSRLYPRWTSSIPSLLPWPRLVGILVAAGLLFSLIWFFVPAVRQWLFAMCGRFQPASPRYSPRLLPALGVRWNQAVVWVLSALPFVLIAVIVRDDRQPLGEVFAWIDGISIWPTQCVRLLMLYFVAYVFLLRMRRELIVNKQELKGRFELPFRVPRSGLLGHRPTGPWRLIASTVMGLAPTRTNLRRWQRFWQRHSIGLWDPPAPTGSADSPPEVSAAKLWLAYNDRGFMNRRLKRVLPPTLLYLAAGMVVMALLGFPFRPFRGHVSDVTDRILLGLCVTAQIFLIFLVVDATRLCARMIEHLTAGPTRYSERTVAKFERQLRVHREYLDEWLDVRIIAARTRAVEHLIYYPFITLFLLILSRNNFFDHWTWPAPLLLIMGGNLVIAVYAVVKLQRAAGKARQVSVQSLRGKLLRVVGGEQLHLSAPAAGLTGSPNLVEQIKALIKDIDDCEEGAFAPLARQPLIQALAVPTGGTGLLALMDFFVRM